MFPSEEIEKRRAETITAIRQDVDNPGVRASEALQALLYGAAHPYGRPAKGSVDERRAIPREDLLAHHAARFRPSTLSLVIVGDVARPTAVAEAGRVRSATGRAAVPPEPRSAAPSHARRRGSAVAIEMPDKSQTDIAYGFTSINRLDPTLLPVTG